MPTFIVRRWSRDRSRSRSVQRWNREAGKLLFKLVLDEELQEDLLCTIDDNPRLQKTFLLGVEEYFHLPEGTLTGVEAEFETWGTANPQLTERIDDPITLFWSFLSDTAAVSPRNALLLETLWEAFQEYEETKAFEVL